MAELPDELYDEIQRLCVEGNELLDKEQFDAAVTQYESAWQLLPDPQTGWDAVSGGQVRATLAPRLDQWPLFVNGGQRT